MTSGTVACRAPEHRLWLERLGKAARCVPVDLRHSGHVADCMAQHGQQYYQSASNTAGQQLSYWSRAHWYSVNGGCACCQGKGGGMCTCSRKAVASTAWLSASCCICSRMCALHSCSVVYTPRERQLTAANASADLLHGALLANDTQQRNPSVSGTSPAEPHLLQPLIQARCQFVQAQILHGLHTHSKVLSQLVGDNAATWRAASDGRQSAHARMMEHKSSTLSRGDARVGGLRTLYSSSRLQETARLACTACTASRSFDHVASSKSDGSLGFAARSAAPR